MPVMSREFTANRDFRGARIVSDSGKEGDLDELYPVFAEVFAETTQILPRC